MLLPFAGLGEQMQDDLAVDGRLENRAARSSSSRRTPALTRLPLCAMAIWPRSQSTTNGCALASVLEPVVE